MAKRRKGRKRGGKLHVGKTTRKFGRRRLKCAFAWDTKAKANKFAKNARERGRIARVVKGEDSAGYIVYGVCTGKAR